MEAGTEHARAILTPNRLAYIQSMREKSRVYRVYRT